MSISIKQLHQTTGEFVRRAAKAKSPIEVTDRGKPIAILASPALFPTTRRRRTLLADYKALLSRRSSADILDDLNAIRSDR
jgi:prevent-host-death family protein